MSKYYVCMTDKFMSGWGQADKLINKLVLECDSWDEAEIVAANARRRPEMRYVNINYNRPHYNPSYYLTSFHTKADYSRWYEPNQFGSS